MMHHYCDFGKILLISVITLGLVSFNIQIPGNIHAEDSLFPQKPGGKRSSKKKISSGAEAVEEDAAPLTTSQIAPQPPTTPKPKRKRMPKKPRALPPELARITVHFSNVSLSTFLKAITKQTKVNFIVSNEHLEKKKITAFLEGVTLEEALQVLLGIQGLAYEKIPGKRSTYLITRRKDEKPRTVTKVFELNFIPLRALNIEAESGEGDGEISSSVGVTGFSDTGEAVTQDDGGGEAKEGSPGIIGVLKSVMSGYGRITTDSRTNSLIITELPEKFPEIEGLIRKLDKKSPQITIETQIVEVNSDGLQRLGLEFGGPNGELMRFTGPSRATDWLIRKGGLRKMEAGHFWPRGNLEERGISVSADDPQTGISFGMVSFAEFQVLLKAIVTKTGGKILSRPKVMTINNQTAEIKIVANQAIGVTATVVEGGGGTQGVERQMTGIVMRVTPQVNSDGYVNMIIEPKMTRAVPSLIGGTSTLDPVTRSVRSMVRVRDGDTIVVGGLMDTREDRTVRKVPILGYIPIIGWFFTSKTTTKMNSELAIFLTPTVMDI
ncbi:secretin N-terminal domain-containing protein [Elusimicrobiota bacterium]